MSTLSDIKTALREMLPSGQRLKVDKHKEVNDKLLDYMFIPFGIALPYFGSINSEYLPPNFVLADGSSYLKADYPIAAAIFGDTYARPEDPIDSFRVPKIKPGSSLIQSGTEVYSNNGGAAWSGSFTWNLGDAGGTTKHKLSSVESGLPAVTIDLGRHADSSTGTDAGFEGITMNDGGTRLTTTLPATAASQPHNIMNPYIVCNYIIRLDTK